MKLLVMDDTGLLGHELTIYLESYGVNVSSYSFEEMNDTKAKEIKDILMKEKPDYIFHCGSHSSLINANSINEEDISKISAEIIAKEASQIGATMIYISSSYVFGDHNTTKKYSEEDVPKPTTKYGKENYEAEKAIQRHMSKYYIVRTSLLYGKYNNNIYYHFMNMGDKYDKVSVPKGDYFQPTLTSSVVKFLLYLIEKEKEIEYGIYHFSAQKCSLKDFANGILKDRITETSQIDLVINQPILSIEKVKSVGVNIPTWQDELISMEENLQGKDIKKFMESTLIWRAQEIYDFYKSFNPKMEKRRLQFVIRRKNEIGASASQCRSIDKIYLNQGVIDNYHYYFMEYVDYKTLSELTILLPNLDNLTNEYSYETIIYRDGKAYTYDSKDMDQDLVILLSTFVSRFMLTHELAHIIMGHCSYIGKKESYQATISFSNTMIKDDNTSLDLRTLEVEADEFAATDCLEHIITRYHRFEKEHQKHFMFEAKNLFLLWSYAIRTNFILMEAKTGDRKYVEKYNEKIGHLPSLIRWELFLKKISILIDEETFPIKYKNGDTKKVILEQIAAGSRLAEQYYEEARGNTHSWLETIQQNESTIKRYYKEIEKNGYEIHQEVSKYSLLNREDKYS